MKNNLKKNIIWNLIGSTFNSCTSLFFLIIVTRINGINNAGIFTFAFSNACLLQVIGIYATRSYQVTENNKKLNDNVYVNAKIVSCFLMILIGIIYGIIKGYTYISMYTIILLVIYKALDGFSESIYAIMQKNNDLYKVGISLLIKGIIGFLTFFVCDYLTNNMILSIVLLIISNIIIIFLYDLKCIQKYKYKFSKVDFKYILIIFKLAFWTFLFTFMTQYLINASKYAINNHLNNNMQTIYGIISMPATVMMLMANFIIHPFLNKISKYVEQNDIKSINNILIKMIIILLLISIFGVVAAYFLGIPFLNILYGVNLSKYVNNLVIVIIGSSIYSMTIIFSNVLVALRKTISQTIIFVIISILTFIISNIFVKKYGVNGATYSYLLSMIGLLILYIIDYIYIIKKCLRKFKDIYN